MEPEQAEEHGHSVTEEETMALQKKRARRVSFAEMTSVHIFNRDEDYETPPDTRPSSDEASKSNSEEDLLGLHPDSAPETSDSKDSSQNEEEDDDDGDELVSRRSFLRPIESPSPGSAIGSATSNDEDNFFGPVSSSFIRPGRLSGSAASDENHDITMDSTAFTLHYQSLVRSDSGVDLKTPTGVRLSFGEKTPTETLGSSMVLTVANKPNNRSTPINKLTGGNDSNDMSLVAERLHRYDYDRLSPGLDALLAEGGKSLHDIHASDNISVIRSSREKEHKLSSFKEGPSGLLNVVGDREIREVNDSESVLKSPSKMESELASSKERLSHQLNAIGGKEVVEINIQDMATEPVSFVHNRLGEKDNKFGASPTHQVIYRLLSNASDDPVPKTLSSNQLTEDILVNKNRDSFEDAYEVSRPALDYSIINPGIVSNLDNNSQLDSSAHHDHESPSASSGSSLSAKQRHVLVESTTSPKSARVLTPSHKQQGSLVRNETLMQYNSSSSIQKSISRLKSLEASPFSSILDANFDNSKLTSSNYSFKTPPYDTGSDRHLKAQQVNDVNASVTNSLEKSLRVALIDGEKGSAISMKYDGREAPKDAGNANHTEPVYTSIIHRDQPITTATMTVSPSGLSSTSKTKLNFLIEKDPAEGTLITSLSNSSVTNIGVDFIKGKEARGTPHKSFSSLDKRLENLSLTYLQSQNSSPQDVRPYDPSNSKLAKFVSQDATSTENYANASLSITSNEKLDSLSMERRATSVTSVIGVDHYEKSTLAETVVHSDVPVLPDDTGNKSFLTSRDRNIRNLLSESRELTFQTGRGFENPLPGEGIKASSSGPSSPLDHRNTNELQIKKNLLDLFTRSPLQKEQYNVRHNDNLVEHVLSPKSDQLPTSWENSSSRKRKNDEITLRRQHVDDIATNQRSPKHLRGGNYDLHLLEFLDGSNSGKSVRFLELKHWTDIYTKFSENTKHLLTKLIHKLNLHAIDVLEDILIQLQRSKRYQMLSSDIQFQNTPELLSNIQHRRLAETRSLQHRIVHEQAKLQLMHVKREKLQRKAQLLGFRIQESQMLTLTHLPLPSLLCATDVQVNGHSKSLLNNFEGIQEVDKDKVTAMEQVLENLRRRIMSLTKSLYTCCKLKGEPSSTDAIAVANHHLMKRACCRFIHLNLQFWAVDNLESGNGHHHVIINYLGFISQRLTVTVGPISSILICNKFNNTNIMRSFPNMDACNAFAFVLNSEATQNYGGSKSLAQHTQITNFLLGNLLDVAEEIQLAQIELQNLTQTIFYSASGERLELQLSFLDLRSGRKVMLTLDMSCLRWGVYPSDIFPSQIVAVDAAQHSLSKTFLADIRVAIQNLRAGYLRVIRLCRSVSQVLQATCR